MSELNITLYQYITGYKTTLEKRSIESNNPFAYEKNSSKKTISSKSKKTGPDLNFFPECESIYENSKKEPRAQDVFVVGAHGNESAIYEYPNPTKDSEGNIVRGLGEPISPVKLAKMIKESPNYVEGMPVVLWSCNTGKIRENGIKNYAQQLADSLGPGAKVIAPNKSIWFWSNKPCRIYDKKETQINGVKKK